ncbi:hypothetical protein INR49_032296 [Caranx melampygus]|nr:hypothetical protein INR49_032296 [Caranx melampygus]
MRSNKKVRNGWETRANLALSDELGHEISYPPSELLSPHHQLVTKDGDLLSAHGYTHLSASCYRTRNANFKNHLTA